MRSKNTPIVLKINDTISIPAILNSTKTANELKKLLPFSVNASKGEFDFCGLSPELPTDNAERQAGWKNGDIGYSKGWFALFHDGETQSSGYTSEMIIGHIDHAI